MSDRGTYDVDRFLAVVTELGALAAQADDVAAARLIAELQLRVNVLGVQLWGAGSFLRSQEPLEREDAVGRVEEIAELVRGLAAALNDAYPRPPAD